MLLVVLLATGCSKEIITKVDTRTEYVTSVIHMSGILMDNNTAISTNRDTYVILGTVEAPKTIMITTTNKYTLEDNDSLKLIHSTSQIIIDSRQYNIL